MAKSDQEIRDKFAGQLFPGEQILHLVAKGITCKFDNTVAVPVYLSITGGRLLLLQKHGLFKKSLGLELSQVIEFNASGTILPKLTLATTGGQRVLFTLISKEAIALIQNAVGAARSR